MDLIERYLGAVRWNLPIGKPMETRADDIIAELRDLIESRIEEREADSVLLPVRLIVRGTS